jgi:hypothetical protein
VKQALRGASTRGLFSVILLIALLVSGCTPKYKVRAFDAVDQSDRTITVPEGGGLTGAIKDALVVDGWKITVYRGPDVTQGKMASRWTHFERVRTFTTRYALFLKWSRIVFDRCISSFDPIYAYDISVVDNATDSEVLRVTGRGCEASIADTLPGGAQRSKEVATLPARPPTLVNSPSMPTWTPSRGPVGARSSRYDVRPKVEPARRSSELLSLSAWGYFRARPWPRSK